MSSKMVVPDLVATDHRFHQRLLKKVKLTYRILCVRIIGLPSDGMALVDTGL